MTTMKARLSKARKRAAKTQWLRTKCNKASKLYKTNLKPVASYGTSAYGIAPTMMRAMRVTAGQAALGARGQCTTTAIDLAFGMVSDPEASIPLRSWPA